MKPTIDLSRIRTWDLATVARDLKRQLDDDSVRIILAARTAG